MVGHEGSRDVDLTGYDTNCVTAADCTVVFSGEVCTGECSLPRCRWRRQTYVLIGVAAGADDGRIAHPAGNLEG